MTSADAEERARAEWYGLLARLWHAPPDAALWARFSTADAPPGSLLEPLVGALRGSSVEAAAREYDALFGGVGRPEVFLYGSYYLSGFLNERPLAVLRADLAPLGLTRDRDSGETEDHVAYLFEVMRTLIEDGDLDRQRRFFRAHVQSWVDALCDAVEAHPAALVWRAVAQSTRTFVNVEAQAFDLLDT